MAQIVGKRAEFENKDGQWWCTIHARVVVGWNDDFLVGVGSGQTKSEALLIAEHDFQSAVLHKEANNRR